MTNVLKRFVFALGLVALVGAGCLGGGEPEKELVTGDWWLTFDLPENWVMVANYSKEVADPTQAKIDRVTTDVVLQNTTLPVLLSGGKKSDVVPAYQESNYTYIRVFRYDVNLTRIPKEAEDIGGGFFKETDDGTVIYWFRGVYGNYKFKITQDGQDISIAEAVIKTAKEVTDGPVE